MEFVSLDNSSPAVQCSTFSSAYQRVQITINANCWLAHSLFILVVEVALCE